MYKGSMHQLHVYASGVNDTTGVLTCGVSWNPRGFNLRVKTRGYKPLWLYNLPPVVSHCIDYLMGNSQCFALQQELLLQ